VNTSDRKKWVDVVFPHPPLQRFTYEIPEKFHNNIELGQRVLVPLGNRKMTGFVVDFIPQPEVQNLREIEDILDPYPLLTSELLKLTCWVAEYYLASWGEVIRAALPPSMHWKSRLLLQSIKGAPPPKEPLTETESRILSMVQKKEKISLEEVKRQIKSKGIGFSLGKLEKWGLIETIPVLEHPRVQEHRETWIALREELEPEDIRVIGKRAPRQAKVLETLFKCGGEAERGDLEVDLSTLRRLKKNGWIELWEEETFREPYPDLETEPPKTIQQTQEQKAALSQIQTVQKQNTFHTFLLHGVTASGKTQVYIEAIRQVLARGKTALVLIPEISLTPQAVQRYRGAFGDEVAVLHSRMSAGERFDSWKKIREGKFRIALGPRSAVFAPLENVGLIVVDEEHESSYKQFDPAPRYHARDVAVVRGKLNGCVVLLGSATPSLESYFNALEGKYTLCELTHRVDHVPLPKVTLINQTETQKAEAYRVFSPLLRQKMEEHLKKGEQIILLQNRRGYAHFLRCSACGNIEECAHCNITLTYHLKGHRLRCHYCGFHKAASDICPVCGGTTLCYRGIGTQRVEEEVHKHFPQARLYRMDQDTTRRKRAHQKIITEFEKRKGDVLLGTQMVAKGHDFPGVNLVGIISADTGLYFPDFRAGEKTYQLLTQAAGRAGRRDQQGEVCIQTFSPKNPVLQFAMEQNYKAFYQWEILQRKELCYPPWGKLIVVRFKGGKETRVAEAARIFADCVPSSPFIQCLGPASSPLSKIRGMYRYQIIFRSKRTQDPTGKKVREIIRDAVLAFHKKIRFYDIRVAIDVDPVDMM